MASINISHGDDDDDDEEEGDDGIGEYHCHQCHTDVRPTRMSPLMCPLCLDGFLEECSETRDSSPEMMHDYLGGLGQIFDDISAFLGGNEVPPVNPFVFFQTHMQNIFSIHHDYEDDDMVGLDSFRSPPFGPGLRQLVNQVSENEVHVGPPPASVSAVEQLPTVLISRQHLAAHVSAQCAICKEEFEQCLEAKQMPCKHIYHAYCILPWLAQHNSCPVCRYELPTDDPDYERTRPTYPGPLSMEGTRRDLFEQPDTMISRNVRRTRPTYPGPSSMEGTRRDLLEQPDTMISRNMPPHEVMIGPGSSSDGDMRGQCLHGRILSHGSGNNLGDLYPFTGTAGLPELCNRPGSAPGGLVNRPGSVAGGVVMRRISTAPRIIDMVPSSPSRSNESNTRFVGPHGVAQGSIWPSNEANIAFARPLAEGSNRPSNEANIAFTRALAEGSSRPSVDTRLQNQDSSHASVSEARFR